MWNSAIPRVWKELTLRPFLSLKDKKRDTLQFLVETQKYIHRIRKPLVMDEDEMAVPGWEEKLTTRSPIEGKTDRPVRRPASISLMDLRASTRLSTETERKLMGRRKTRRVFSDITQRPKAKVEIGPKVNTWRKPRQRKRNSMGFAQFMQETMRD